MAKSPDAFRTISEVADWLGIQAHVLRFWESKFTQVKPIKRAGGRRYYRPADMQLLGGIKKLLHDDGLTIKGVQKILREEGMNHVAAMSAPLDELTASQMEDMPEAAAPPPPIAPVEPEKGVVLSFESAADKNVNKAPEGVENKEDTAPEAADESVEAAQQPPAAVPDVPIPDDAASATPSDPSVPASDVSADRSEPEQQDDAAPAGNDPEPVEDPAPVEEAPMAEDVAETEFEPMAEEPADIRQADTPDPEPEAPEPDAPAATPEDRQALPAFLRRPLDGGPADISDNTPPRATQGGEAPAPQADAPQSTPASQSAPADPPEETVPPAPKPRVLPDLALTAEQDFDAIPAVLTTAYRLRSLNRNNVARIEPLVARLTTLRDSMAARRRNGGSPPSNS